MKRAASRGLALAVFAVVGWASLTPAPPSPAGLPSYADLVVHVAMHAALAWSLAQGWPRRGATLAALVAAVALEGLQAGVPGRTFDPRDLAANLAGAAVGLALARLPARRWARRLFAR